jgi:hypothetical protein
LPRGAPPAVADFGGRDPHAALEFVIDREVRLAP